MRRFDEAFAREIHARIRGLPDGAVPRWGRMRKPDLIRHLLAALRFSMGEASFGIPPQRGRWIRKILKWLILDVQVPMIKNIRFRDERGAVVPLMTSEGSLDDLESTLVRMARATPAEVAAPPPHPYFGELTLDEWKRLHVRHIDHHLRQFDAV